MLLLQSEYTSMTSTSTGKSLSQTQIKPTTSYSVAYVKYGKEERPME